MQSGNGQDYQTIQEVAELLGISKSLIRFWEEEFDLPRREDNTLNPLEVDQLKSIQYLISEREMPLEDAKIAFLKEKQRLEAKHKTLNRLIEIRQALANLKKQI